jgi:hypothetical protein
MQFFEICIRPKAMNFVKFLIVQQSRIRFPFVILPASHKPKKMSAAVKLNRQSCNRALRRARNARHKARLPRGDFHRRHPKIKKSNPNILRYLLISSFIESSVICFRLRRFVLASAVPFNTPQNGGFKQIILCFYKVLPKLSEL